MNTSGASKCRSEGSSIITKSNLSQQTKTDVGMYVEAKGAEYEGKYADKVEQNGEKKDEETLVETEKDMDADTVEQNGEKTDEETLVETEKDMDKDVHLQPLQPKVDEHQGSIGEQRREKKCRSCGTTSEEQDRALCTKQVFCKHHARLCLCVDCNNWRMHDPDFKAITPVKFCKAVKKSQLLQTQRDYVLPRLAEVRKHKMNLRNVKVTMDNEVLIAKRKHLMAKGSVNE